MITFDEVYKATIIGTFLVLIWYTIETTKIRKIDAQQRDLQLLPAVMIYIRRRSGTERPYIRNIGFGTALAIEVLPSKVTEKDVYDFNFHLVDANNTLEPQEEREIGINLTVNGQHSNRSLPFFQHYYQPSQLQQIEDVQQAGDVHGTIINLATERDLKVHFKDITGQRYETIINFSYKGVSVSKAPERLGK